MPRSFSNISSARSHCSSVKTSPSVGLKLAIYMKFLQRVRLAFSMHLAHHAAQVVGGNAALFDKFGAVVFLGVLKMLGPETDVPARGSLDNHCAYPSLNLPRA